MKVPEFDPYLHTPEGDLTTGRGLLLLEFVRKWRKERNGSKLRVILERLGLRPATTQPTA